MLLFNMEFDFYIFTFFRTLQPHFTQNFRKLVSNWIDTKWKIVDKNKKKYV